MSKRQSEELRYAVDETPPHPLSAALGFQIVVLVIAGIVITPLIVLRAGGATAGEMSWAVFAALFVSGLTTVLQARPVGRFGAGYVLFMGTSGAFIAVSTTAVALGGLPLLATLVVLSSLVQFAFAARLGLFRRIITPTVGGTVVMLIAVAVFPICFGMLTALPEGVPTSSTAGALSALTTFLVILGVSLFTAGRLRLYGPLFGVVAGCVVASWNGLLDLSEVRAVPWVGLPAGSWPGFDTAFDARMWTLLPAFVLVTIVGAIETYGDGIAIQRVSVRDRRPLSFSEVQGAVNADGVGNLLSGVLGTLPNTTYSTSISVVEITGVAARRVGIYGGAIMMALAFLPKVSALLRAVPDAVAGAYILILLVLLFAHGLRLVSEDGLSYQNGFVVGLSFWIGIGFQNQLIFREQIPSWAHTVLDNGMTSGGLTAVVLTALLQLGRASGDRLRLDPEVSSVPLLHEFLEGVAAAAGWDKAGRDRLQLVGEEALVFLVEKEQESERPAEQPIRLAARRENDRIVLEFGTGPGSDNIEGLVHDLDAEDRTIEEDVGLRILGSLVEELRHQQFRDRNYLMLVVDSAPLSRSGGGVRRSVQ